MRTAREQAMFFIVGRGRSGTTLLSRMLDGRRGVFVAPESLFVMNTYRRYRAGRWNALRRRRFLRDVGREERMLRWRLDAEVLEGMLVDLGPDAAFADVCSTVYRASALGHGREEPILLGDKNPLYALFVPELLETFPGARFLHVVRDYRDNVLSYRDVPFDLSSPSALAYRWRRYNQVIVGAAAENPERFLRLRYEDLVRDTDGTLARIGDFLGIALEPRETATENRVETTLPWHRHLGRPTDGSQVAKWRSRMAPELVARVDAVCQPLGERLGYPSAPGARSRLAALDPRALAGVAVGASFTHAERLLFRLPLELRTTAIRAYRLATGNRIAEPA